MFMVAEPLTELFDTILSMTIREIQVFRLLWNCILSFSLLTP